MSPSPNTGDGNPAQGESATPDPPGPLPEAAAIPPAGLGAVRVGGRSARSSSSAFRDLSTGSIPRHVVRLAWPQMAENVLNIVDQLVDLVWAGRLPGGFRAIAGVGVSQTFTQFGMMSRQGFDQAMRAMVSRAVGAGNVPLANHVALQAFTLSFAYSLIIVLVGWLLTDVFLRIIGASQSVQTETAMYMRVQFVGTATMAVRMMTGAALQASGDVMVPLFATISTRLLHIVLTPFLMFGWWFFPNLGLPGAALANVLAQLTGSSVNLYFLFQGYSRLHLTLKGYHWDKSTMWQIVKLGAPASAAAVERAMSQLILLRFVSPFGDVAMAGYSLTRRMEMFANFGAMGLGQASGIMVGQNLGARRPERARRSVGYAVLFVAGIAVTVGAIIVLFPSVFINLFTHDPEVVALTSTWLRIQVGAALFMGLAVVLQQSFFSAGDTVAPMIITFLAVWFVEIPSAWLLSSLTVLGPLGIGFGNMTGTASRFFLYVHHFFRGNWLKKQVF